MRSPLHHPFSAVCVLVASLGMTDVVHAAPPGLVGAELQVGPPTAVEAGAATEQGYSGLLQVVPAIEWTTPEAVEDAWLRVKAISDPVLQVKALEAERLYQKACRGLVDLRSLQSRRALDKRPFMLAFRDDHRGRSWLQPHVMSVVEEAIERFGRKFRRRKPKPIIMAGDAAQPGCGQLEYGAIVKMVSDTSAGRSATELLNRAHLVDGVPTVVTRDQAPGARAFTETRIVGHAFGTDGRLTLRTVVRRFTRGSAPHAKRTARVMETADALVKAKVVTHKQVQSWSDAKNALMSRWVTHFVGRYKQMVAVTRAPLDPTKPLSDQLGSVVELRFSKRVLRKPLSFKDEVRWTSADVDPERTPTGWERWALVHEAGHQTHIAGRDLDVGYVTEKNEFTFTTSPEKVDVPMTWYWFESLDRAARRSGTALQRIIVGPRMHRLFKKELALKKLDSRLFKQVVKVAPGHDGHHHIRVAPVTTMDAPIAERLMRPLSIIYAELFGAE